VLVEAKREPAEFGRPGRIPTHGKPESRTPARPATREGSGLREATVAERKQQAFARLNADPNVTNSEGLGRGGSCDFAQDDADAG
jgi:hypothetical protein